ncbi:hypothetical protein [Streptomyces sp. NBC_01477]|uniref:hypothetical protein n=1 Tax=Streptomyces sp. NBC_01477 TaxID=2976015 RepID=UPI002E348C37|nr:hypothetical protein [Streptomyces sp. NBC_01477]
MDQWPVAAAATSWALHRDAAVVLPVLRRALESERSGVRRDAAVALARLGEAAGPALPGLRALAARGGSPWEQFDALRAVWKATRDARFVAAPLREVWCANPYTRKHIADCLRDMGEDAAAFDLALLSTEAGDPRRSVFRAGGWGSHDIHDDEALLASCRAALAAVDRAPA